MRLTLDHPLGSQLTPGVVIQRQRPLWAGGSALVTLGELVRADQVLAEGIDTRGEERRLIAGMAGRITEIVAGDHITIAGTATVLDGMVGAGGVVAGPLVTLQRGEALAVTPIQPGSIVLFPQQVPLTLLQRAVSGGALAIVAGSALVRELEAFVRMDISAMLDGSLPEPRGLPLTIVLTEGFGAMAMRPSIAHMLNQQVGATVLISGRTDPRKNIRPEIILPAHIVAPPRPPSLPALKEGSTVAIMAGRLRGREGEIAHLYARKQYVSPGLSVQCASVRLDDGTSATVPLHALDRIG